MKDRIEILQPDRRNFNEASMDAFDRFQRVENTFRMEEGRLVLKRQPFTEDWTIARKREKAAEIRSGRYTAYCAFAGDTVVGAILLLPEMDNGRMIIDSFHVSRSFRRRGIGRRLFEAAADHARRCGAEALYASCCSAEETIRFYLAMGFRPSEHPIQTCVEEEPFDIQMECRL